MIVIVLGKISTRNQSPITNNPKQIEEEARLNIQKIQEKSRQNQSVEIEK